MHFLKRMSLAVQADAEVAKVAIYHHGKILVGKRTDNEKWDLPGGHLELQETPDEALIREVEEETMLRLPTARYLGKELVANSKGDLVLVHCYMYKAQNSLLPEETDEMKDWQWTPAEKGNPIFGQNWANPDDVVLQKIGVL